MTSMTDREKVELIWQDLRARLIATTSPPYDLTFDQIKAARQLLSIKRH